MPPIHDPRILNAIYAGEKISAIKLYRDAYPGMDLSQAKDAVEALEEELRRQAPEQFRGGASPTGIPASGNPEVVRAIYAGEKIAAIRLYREANPGIGLKEAKDEVERTAAELYRVHPEKFTRPPNASGCAGLILAVPLAIGILWWILR